MRNAWDLHADEWISWARAPGHDSYWRFHREAFLPLVPGEHGSVTRSHDCPALSSLAGTRWEFPYVRSERVDRDRGGPRRGTAAGTRRLGGLPDLPGNGLLGRAGNRVPRHPVHPAELCAVSADRKSTRLNSSHVKISYAVFCL